MEGRRKDAHRILFFFSACSARGNRITGKGQRIGTGNAVRESRGSSWKCEEGGGRTAVCNLCILIINGRICRWTFLCKLKFPLHALPSDHSTHQPLERDSGIQDTRGV